jgi:rRNA maturation endonuclease Nob1
MEDLAPEAAAVAAPPPPRRAAPLDAAAPRAAQAPAQRPVPETCRWCRAELPARANLNFCPFCGTDVHVVPCPGCGEELDPEWRFCISCGAEVGG